MDKLTGSDFRTMARASAARLEAEKARVDALNVFPVPDGDTGTNMALTLWSAVDAVLRCPSDELGDLAQAAAEGALLGARGNSGVILSQFLRGFADGVAGLAEADPLQLAQAFVRASEAAYGAVLRPVEGTVLTVGKEAALAALRLAESGADLYAVFEGSLAQARETLARTPEMLATLAEAGVVDAGGEGLVVLATGAWEALNGSVADGLADTPLRYAPPPVAAAAPPEENAPASTAPPKRTGITATEEISYRYCTELLIKGEQIDRAVLARSLEDLGDSMLVVGERDVVKVHIHSNHPGLVLELCASWGELNAIHVQNMAEQNRQAAQREATPELPPSLPARKEAAPPPEVAVVAVSSGAGCAELLRSLGASHVVAGGQTMNPSTEELLEAITATRARSVIVLPNNRNVLMTARQAAHLATIPVTVVPTRSFCEGVAAMLQYEPSEPSTDNVRRMEEAISSVVSGEITVAVRDARVNGLAIKEGDLLGISNGDIKVVGTDRSTVLQQLVAELVKPEHALITLYYGEGVTEEEAAAAAASLQELHDVEVETYNGGQPVYHYLLSLE